MNCPIRTDPAPDEGHNQNPSDMANEVNTNNTLNHRRNSTNGRNGRIHLEDGSHGSIGEVDAMEAEGLGTKKGEKVVATDIAEVSGQMGERVGAFRGGSRVRKTIGKGIGNGLQKVKGVLLKYVKFMGPGFMVAVAYIDPGMEFYQSLWHATQIDGMREQETMRLTLRLVRHTVSACCS